MARNDPHIVGLDLGTTEVRAIIGEVVGEGRLEVVGIGRAESRGVRKGVVVNLEATTDAIRRAVEEAELMSGVQIDSAYVGIGGAQIKGHNSRGVIAVSRRNREIGRADVDRVIEQARSIALAADREIVDVIPQEFTVDGQDGIINPLGFLGMRLEAAVHLVSSPITARQNVITSVNRAGILVLDTVLEHWAASEAALTEDEKEYGTALVDIGGETTNLAIYHRGSVQHTAVLPIGGSHFTSDIAVGLRTPIPEAERIKRAFGCAISTLMDDHERSMAVEVPSVGGRPPRLLSRQVLCEILQPRAEEIFSHVYEEIEKNGFERQLSSGIVIVGGGALMDGTIEIAEHVLELTARCGSPRGIGGLSGEIASPEFATAAGLLLYGYKRQSGAGLVYSDAELEGSRTGRLRGMVRKLFR
jgi:cell division protein FtsA